MAHAPTLRVPVSRKHEFASDNLLHALCFHQAAAIVAEVSDGSQPVKTGVVVRAWRSSGTAVGLPPCWFRQHGMAKWCGGTGRGWSRINNKIMHNALFGRCGQRVSSYIGDRPAWHIDYRFSACYSIRACPQKPDRRGRNVRSGGWWTFAYYACKTLQWISGVGVVSFALAPKLDGWLSGITFLAKPIAASHPYITPAVIGFSAGVVAFKWLASMIGPPWIWKAIRGIIDEFRERAFASAGDPVHHHRVTLFEHTQIWRFWRLWDVWITPWTWRRGRTPWSGWLLPVCRSGHTTQHCSTRFLAPDNADYAEGVAGQVWARNSQIVVNDLPLVDENTPDDVIADYASKTFVSSDWVKNRRTRPLPRCLCGVPIEVDGRIWGVLVLDSRGQNTIRSRKVSDLVDFVGIVLRHLLRRAK